ncbi:MAG: hypothetical protein GY702_23930 [Desulfobulbaceae bacterium]|nr:hypothetical protein [Desulfobulbaceae bacterium]
MENLQSRLLINTWNKKKRYRGRHFGDKGYCVGTVMYLGGICELAPAEALFSRPAHPYTAALINAIPRAIPGNSRLSEIQVNCDFTTATGPSDGCRFHRRCPGMKSLCAEQLPTMSKIANEYYVACHFPLFEDLVK